MAAFDTVVINGSGGTGKTTTAEMLGDLLRQHDIPGAVIDVDWLRCFECERCGESGTAQATSTHRFPVLSMSGTGAVSKSAWTGVPLRPATAFGGGPRERSEFPTSPSSRQEAERLKPARGRRRAGQAGRAPTLVLVITIEPVAPASTAAAGIVRAYMEDVASRWYGRPASIDEGDQALRDEPYDDLQGDTGLLLVALDDGRPVGCAGVRFLDGTAELTKVFTARAHRGRGIAPRLLDAVDVAVRARGIATLRLDTRAALTEACALYERHGYERVDPFNDEPYSDRWYCKTLAGPLG